MTISTNKRQYTLRDVQTFLIDCLGYSEGDCKEMTYPEMLFAINDSGNLLNFQEFTANK